MKKKIQLIFTVVVMLSLVLSVSLITSCEKDEEVKKPEPANTNKQPEQNDSIPGLNEIADSTSLNDSTDSEIGVYERWECNVTAEGRNVIITLDMYEEENKFITTLSDTTLSNPDYIYFKHNEWIYFFHQEISIPIELPFDREDYYRFEHLDNGALHFRSGDYWVVEHPNDTTMTMNYFGNEIGVPLNLLDYTFILK